MLDNSPKVSLRAAVAAFQQLVHESKGVRHMKLSMAGRPVDVGKLGLQAKVFHELDPEPKIRKPRPGGK